MASKPTALTDLTAERLRPPKTGRTEVFDRLLPGFYLRVSSTGARAWMFKYCLAGVQKKASLGLPGELKVDDARALAREIIQGGQKRG